MQSQMIAAEPNLRIATVGELVLIVLWAEFSPEAPAVDQEGNFISVLGRVLSIEMLPSPSV